MSRSEANHYNTTDGTLLYTDLDLTIYPKEIDSRNTSDPGYNVNMKGFTNLQDYNMAEHVNALADAVMSVERTLGVNPQIDGLGVTHTTVSQRILDLENKNFDARYGGVGWSSTSGQTLVGHTHTGEAGHPSQIKLDSEVQNELPKSHIDLTQSTGLTGSDIFINPQISTSVNDAVADKLSTSQGGMVSKKLDVQGRFLSHFFKEWTCDDFTGGTIVNDWTSEAGRIRRFGGTSSGYFMIDNVNNLCATRYVLGVRLRVSSQVGEEVFVVAFDDFNEGSGNWDRRVYKGIRGDQFPSANVWKTFYYVFDHYPVSNNKATALHFLRANTQNSVNVDVDCAYVMPITPAVFDS